MSKNRFSKGVLFAMTSGLLTLSLLFFVTNHRGLNRRLVAWPAAGADKLGSIFRIPGEWFEGLSREVSSLLDAYEENKSLKKRLVALENQDRLIKELEEDNAQLRQQLDLNQVFKPSLLISTRVSSRSTVAWLDFVTVDKGSRDLVRPRMFLVSDQGLLGVVSQVTEESSQVTLLTNSEVQEPLAVKVASGKDWVYGVILGYDQERSALKIGQFNQQEGLEEGAKVLTSGLDGSSVADVPVGELVAMERAKDQSLIAYVRLSAETDDLSAVQLLGRAADEN